MIRNWVNCWEPKAMYDAKVISSQANQERGLEGSETRDRVKTVMSPRVPNALFEGEDIVRHSMETWRGGLNSHRYTDVKNTTYKMEHIRLFKALQKLSAFNTVEEYNQIQSYGENPDAGWIDEGDLPEEDDARYERKFSVNYCALAA